MRHIHFKNNQNCRHVQVHNLYSWYYFHYQNLEVNFYLDLLSLQLVFCGSIAILKSYLVLQILLFANHSYQLSIVYLIMESTIFFRVFILDFSFWNIILRYFQERKATQNNSKISPQMKLKSSHH